MDFSESTKVVYNRIQRLDPENVTRIIGYLLLQEHCDRDMIRLAFGPDTLIQSLIQKAKSQLSQNKPAVSASIPVSQVNQAPVADLPVQFVPYSPALSHVIPSPSTIRAPGQNRDPQITAGHQQVNNSEFASPGYSDSAAEDYHLINQLQSLNLEDQLESDYFASSDFLGKHCKVELASGARTSRRSLSLHEFPVKLCHYFNKGYCKHGNKCRYIHGHLLPESFSRIFASNPEELANEGHTLSPGSLEKLEFELIELLRSRKGLPVSIASLPMMYFEKYGKTLQAEGCLTDSQRDGKAGYSLTKLLGRLKKRIYVIDRPYGQHSVILAEDVPKYLDHAGERSNTGGTVDVSRQIYITFPAESAFTERDVFNYFNQLGQVQDVRIPCQRKRMFGFVTFAHAETVKQVLAKGNPHFVYGAHVLVKPYREKSRLADRKFTEKVQHPVHYGKRFEDGDPELQSMPKVYGNSRLLKKLLMAEHEQALALEFERRRLAGFQFASQQHLTCPSMDEFKLTDEEADFPSGERFDHLLDILNGGSTSDDNLSQGSFSSIGKSIRTVS